MWIHNICSGVLTDQCMLYGLCVWCVAGSVWVLVCRSSDSVFSALFLPLTHKLVCLKQIPLQRCSLSLYSAPLLRSRSALLFRPGNWRNGNKTQDCKPIPPFAMLPSSISHLALNATVCFSLILLLLPPPAPHVCLRSLPLWSHFLPSSSSSLLAWSDESLAHVLTTSVCVISICVTDCWK